MERWWFVQTNLPTLKGRLCGLSGDGLQDELGSSPLSMLGIDHQALFINLNNIRENRVHLFE